MTLLVDLVSELLLDVFAPATLTNNLVFDLLFTLRLLLTHYVFLN